MVCSLIDSDNMTSGTRPACPSSFWFIGKGNVVPATSRSFRKHFLSALVGMISLTGMSPNAQAQCQSQKLLPDDGASGDVFGTSVAISGDTAVIGAWGDDDLGRTNFGSAYVFEQLGGIWTQTAKLKADDGALLDRLGGSVDKNRYARFGRRGSQLEERK